MRAADLLRQYRKNINPPYGRKDLFVIGTTIFLLLIIPLTVILATQNGDLRSRAAGGDCDTSYPTDRFRVCYYDYTGGGIGSSLGSVDEATISDPVPQTYMAINHPWSSGTIYGGLNDNVSGVWRGRLNFPQGRYQFTVQANDGVRLFINEVPVIEEWRDQEYSYAAVKDLNGYTNIRVEWYDHTDNATLSLHWYKGSKPPFELTSPVNVDFFILPQVNTCIVGNPWTSGDTFNVYNPNGTVFKAFQSDSTLTSLKPSNPHVNDGTYAQSVCLSLAMTSTEQTRVKDDVERVFQNVKTRHSLGLFDVSVRTITLGPVEAQLSRWGGFWLASWDLQWNLEPSMASYLSKQTDFVIATHGMNEFNGVSYGKYINPPACGGTFGADLGVGGAGYSWVPQTQPGNWYECSTYYVYINEWLHQLEWAVPNLMGLNDIYVDDATGVRTYPACGTYDPDTYKWFPGLYDLASEHGPGDPDSPWCGTQKHPGADPGSAHLFMNHFDFSMQRYSSNIFNGNHCNGGKKDFDETGVDTGGDCPVSQPQPTVDIKANGSDGPITAALNSSVTLSWSSTNATSCTASGSWSGSKATSGSESTSPLSNPNAYTYTLTCNGAGGSASDSVAVNVFPPAPSVDIKANNSDGPITISYNTSANLSWTSTNATSCTASGSWSGSKATSGSQSTGTLSGPNTYTYTLTCTGAGGSVNDPVTVNVSGPGTAPAVDLRANSSNGPITIVYNTTASLSWTSANASSCTASEAWSGSKNSTGGSESTGRLIGNKTYTLTCTGPGGSASDSVTVNVGKIGDMNLDGLINIRDFSILVSKWGTTDQIADLNGDGTINIRDFSILVSRWGS